MWHCCKLNYSSLGDTVLFLKTKSRGEAERWLTRQGRYFASVILTEEEYLERIKRPIRDDTAPL